MAKKRKVKLKKDNILIIILSIILVGLLVYLFMMAKDIFKKEEEKVPETKVVDKLDDYGYFLTDNNTEYYKKLFDELKDTLNAEELDDEAYATLVAKMFTADFYDLDSKLSKGQVGGTQFIIDKYEETFIKKATSSNGMYYYIESNLYDERKQELSKVKNVELVSLKSYPYKYQDINDEKGYQVNVKIEYEKDLGYPTTVALKLVHVDNKIYVAEVA